MTLTNVYATLDSFRSALGMDSLTVVENGRLEAALNAASRLIDDHCGRRFFVDTAVVDRQYYADDGTCVEVDDISTLTGLVVKTDTNADGTFSTTLTRGTNYVLLPLNAEDDGRPYEELRMVDGVNAFPVWSNGRPGVQVTARFGWASVPDAVRLACQIQAAQLLKAGDAPFGVLQLSTFDGAAVRIGTSLHPSAEALLVGFSKPRVA